MLDFVYEVPYLLFEVPNLKLKRPGWVKQPSAFFMFSLVLLSYFLVTGGKFDSSKFSQKSTPNSPLMASPPQESSMT
jgi:hypothetical protein